MNGWRAYYEDMSVYSSSEYTWQSLPMEGMVGVVVYLDPNQTPYRQILDGCDWYWLEDGKVQGLNTHDEWGKFVDPPLVKCAACLKRSGVMHDLAWAEVQSQMWNATEPPSE